MNAIGPGIVAIVAGIIGLAIIAVIVSKNAQTPQVFQGAGSALASVIGAAVQPVSGATSNVFGASGTPGVQGVSG
jgi:hypothetical protein